MLFGTLFTPLALKNTHADPTPRQDQVSTKTSLAALKILSPEYKTLWDKPPSRHVTVLTPQTLSTYHGRLFESLSSGEFSLIPGILKEEKKLSRNPGISYCCEEAFDFLNQNHNLFSPQERLSLSNFLMFYMCNEAFYQRTKHLNALKEAFDPSVWKQEALAAFPGNANEIEAFTPYSSDIEDRSFYLRYYHWQNGSLVPQWYTDQPGYSENSSFQTWKNNLRNHLIGSKGLREFYYRLDFESRIGRSCETDRSKESADLKKNICFLMQVYNRLVLYHSKALDIRLQNARYFPTAANQSNTTTQATTLQHLSKLIQLSFKILERLNSPKNSREMGEIKQEFLQISESLKKHDAPIAALILEGKQPSDDTASLLNLPFINIFEPVKLSTSSAQRQGAHSEEYLGFSVTSLLIGGILAPFTGGASLAIGGAGFIAGTTAMAVNGAESAPKGEGLSSFFSGAFTATSLANSIRAAAEAQSNLSTKAAIESVRASNQPTFSGTSSISKIVSDPPAAQKVASSSQPQLSSDLFMLVRENAKNKTLEFGFKENGRVFRSELPPFVSRNMSNAFHNNELKNWNSFDFIQGCAGNFSVKPDPRNPKSFFPRQYWSEIQPTANLKQAGDVLQMQAKPGVSKHHCAIYLGDNLYLSKIGQGNTDFLVATQQELEKIYPECTHSSLWFRPNNIPSENADSSLYLKRFVREQEPEESQHSFLGKIAKKFVVSNLSKSAQTLDNLVDIYQTFEKFPPGKAASIVGGGYAGAKIGKKVGSGVGELVSLIPPIRVYRPIVVPSSEFLGKCVGGYIGAEFGEEIGHLVDDTIKKIDARPATFPYAIISH